ncbi:MAG: hypothetical protein J4215_03595 [Candidatus Diapherotrites archaeon]|uniref:Uncharacterized protein n=1 Tax=Candidatus Iainarchaeum sp. TaxID=3101447 RepID=A0A8T4L4B5_9ARCH|nr:hypothetical protein [Candidatus Diapherotrites archaeon]
MQAIELVIFLMSAIVVGSLMLMFLGGLKPGEIYDTISSLIFPNRAPDPSQLNRVTLTRFAGELEHCWETCQFGNLDANCGSYYITEPKGDLNKDFLMNLFAKYNYCTDCNIKLDVGIQIPAVVGLHCEGKQIVVEP